MSDLTVNRTLVKSPPELWSEVSEVESLARHLGELGEITITRLDPEHTVAWEGENASGTVELEASGWGTKVTLSADVAPEADPDPAPLAPPAAGDRAWWRRGWLRRRPAAEPEPVAVAADRPAEPGPPREQVVVVLETALDNLGAAHHRPFSREG